MFSNFNLSGFKVFLNRKTSLLLNKVAPGWANKKIDSLLYIPVRKSQKTLQVPTGFKQFVLKTKHGDVHAFQAGKGPAVVFVHGWGGGAYQFFPLMRGLSQIGFTAISFDHLGHGQSDEKPATLQQSISTTNQVLQYVRKNSTDGIIATLVGHSTGCLAIVNSVPSMIENTSMFLISPIFNYKRYFLNKLSSLPLHPKLIKQYASRFEKEYKSVYEKLDLAQMLVKYGDVSTIAHDELDAECPVADSIKFCRKNPLTKLLMTKKYGHERIINSESVWHELKSHLNYEDTSINFAQKILHKEL